MRKAVYLLFTLLVMVNLQIVPTITRNDVTNMLNLIDTLIFDATNTPGGLTIAKICRAMFHDCNLGCDGSINIGST